MKKKKKTEITQDYDGQLDTYYWKVGFTFRN